MADLDLTFIGTGNAFVPEGQCWNGFLANGRILFEAPPTALMALRKLQVDPNAIDTVLISHHHGDHFLGLPMLLLHWKYFGRTTPVTVAGPPGTLANAREIGERVYPGLFEGDSLVQWVALSPGDRLRRPGLEVEAAPMQHDARLVCLGFGCEIDGRRLGYTGDTTYCDAVLDLGRGAEVLVAECTSRDRHSEFHMNLVDGITRVRSALDPATRIILTHLTGHLGETGLAATTVAEDFATYRF